MPTADFAPAASSEMEDQEDAGEGANQASKLRYIGNYELGKTIGEGAFAKVRVGTHRLTNQQVAVKVIDKEKLPDAYAIKHMHREALIMKLLDHPNIVQLYEVIETKKEIYLIMELAQNGELLNFIVSNGRLKEDDAKGILRQIVDALRYCHSLQVVHRDLKAENILLDERFQVKLSDFGLSNQFDRAKSLTTCCGSPVYSAPELIEGKKYAGPEIDVWSIGINLFAMVVGDLPFAESTLGGLFEAISRGRFTIPDFVSAECRDLLGKMLTVNPKKRPTCAEILEHPWLSLKPKLSSSKLSSTNIMHISKPLDETQIDAEIVDQLESMGFERAIAIKAIVGAKYNQVTATYHLLVLQKHREAWRVANEALGPAPSQLALHADGGNKGNSQIVSKLKAAAKMGQLKQGALKGVRTANEEDEHARSSIDDVSEELADKINLLPSHAVQESSSGSLVVNTRRPSAGSERRASSASVTVRLPAMQGSPQVVSRRRAHSTAMSQESIDADRETRRTSRDSVHVSMGPEPRFMQDSDLLNDLPGGNPDVRAVRFNFKAGAASARTPQQIASSLVGVLIRNGMSYTLSGLCYLATAGTALKIEVEVCRLPNLTNIYGVRMRRIAGDAKEFKRTSVKISDELLKL